MQARRSQKIIPTEIEGYGKVHDDTGPCENPWGSRINILCQGQE